MQVSRWFVRLLKGAWVPVVLLCLLCLLCLSVREAVDHS